MSRLTVGSIEGLTENSNVISVPTGHTLNAVDGLQINGVSAGAYTDYSGSITFSSFTLGNGTVDWAYYTQINDFVHYVGQVTLGSTSSVTGNVDVSLPVNALNRERASGRVEFIDSGVGAFNGSAHTYGSVMLIYAEDASATYSRAFNFNATRPFTWTTNDLFAWSIFYRAA